MLPGKNPADAHLLVGGDLHLEPSMLAGGAPKHRHRPCPRHYK